MAFSVKVLAAAVAAAINLVLLVLVSLRSRRHVLFRSFILMTFCLLCWNLRIIISTLSDPTGMQSVYALFITQIFYPAVSACLYILPVAALQFTASIIGLDSAPMRRLVKGAYVVALAMSMLHAADVFSPWLYARLLWLFILPLFALSLFLLGRAFVHSRRPLDRTRFGLLFIAGTIAVTGAVAEDIMISSGINAGGLSSTMNAAYSFIVAACLLRHRLFDVVVTARRAAGMAIAASALIFASYLAGRIFNISEMMPYGHILLAALLLTILGHKMIPNIEKVILRSAGSPYQAIDNIRRSLDQAGDADGLLKSTVKVTMDTIGTAACLCTARDDISGQFTRYFSSDTTGADAVQSKAFEDLICWLDRHRVDEPLVYDELCHRLRFDCQDRGQYDITPRVIEDMRIIGYEVYVPLSIDGELRGIICLANKMNGHAITERDARLLRTIANNCALRLQHIDLSERIRRLETLAALGEMAAIIAHEVRNPLTVIRSAAQMLQSRQCDEATPSMIIDECDRLNRVVTRMLDFTRVQKPNPQRIDVAREIRRWAADIIDARAPKGVRLRIECPPRIPAAMFDPDHLKQIVTNLLLNAIESMAGSGLIGIALKRGDSKITLVIHDNGLGIRREDMGLVFKPFYTTKPGGSGLGLPITRRLLELNNGTIEIRPRPGRGCSVIIQLPQWRGQHE